MLVELVKEMCVFDYEIKVQQELIDVKKYDFVVIKVKYDNDWKCYFELIGCFLVVVILNSGVVINCC